MNASTLTNASSLKALEWGSVQALLVRRATRSVNRIAFETFLPDDSHRTQIETRIGQVEIFRTLLDDGGLRFEGIPEVDEIGGALHYGMFLQSVMVAARGRGLDTCPQAGFVRFLT